MLWRRNACGPKLSAYEPRKASEDVAQWNSRGSDELNGDARERPGRRLSSGAPSQENDVLKRKGMNQGVARMRLRRWFLMGLAVSGFVNVAIADIITFGGTITQSTQDGTGPAANNPTLNNIQDLQAYTVTLGFLGSITTPGTYNLTGGSLTFSV